MLKTRKWHSLSRHAEFYITVRGSLLRNRPMNDRTIGNWTHEPEERKLIIWSHIGMWYDEVQLYNRLIDIIINPKLKRGASHVHLHTLVEAVELYIPELLHVPNTGLLHFVLVRHILNSDLQSFEHHVRTQCCLGFIEGTIVFRLPVYQVETKLGYQREGLQWSMEHAYPKRTMNGGLFFHKKRRPPAEKRGWDFMVRTVLYEIWLNRKDLSRSTFWHVVAPETEQITTLLDNCLASQTFCYAWRNGSKAEPKQMRPEHTGACISNLWGYAESLTLGSRALMVPTEWNCGYFAEVKLRNWVFNRGNDLNAVSSSTGLASLRGDYI
ncbi:uncharacterized protein EDB91DRAFT_1086506 [Suillus paluster]|uniref:uncharacterized protein n=1 Tax=Suillus paluster TaxID=48578 RepID=UPI001B85DDDA|nr:uncharacterized protein EDB91DRAFT_1086506 [Suillus paluster]KAG1727166.1 hypothetical protein EDB91DRAFT_1086506 [Suillus paluster]